MITEQDSINRYINENKIYIPSDYKNSNYKYTLDNDTITIITNNNCRTQYNNQYCDCRKYNVKYNIIGEVYECNSNVTSNLINYNYITDDLNYSSHITNEYTKDYIIYFGIIIVAILLLSTLKKNSRRV